MSILGEPVGTCILAFFLLDETIAAQQFLGMLIILIGLSIFFFYPAAVAAYIYIYLQHGRRGL